MKNKVFNAILVTAIGLLAALLVVILFYADPFVEDSVAYAVTCAVVAFWLFCAPPSYVYSFVRVKERSEGETFEEAFRKGALTGLAFGFGLFFLPLLFAPVAAVLYYIRVFKKV